MQGIIIENIADLYKVESENGNIYECKARGKFKSKDLTPVVGDNVLIEILEEDKKIAVIDNIEERKVYIKRPKLANITKIFFVISCNMPKPDLLLLDKQLAYAEHLKIKPIIIVNKVDLDKKNEHQKIFEEYTKIGYKVILTKAKELIGIKEVQEELKNNISAFSGNSGVGKSTLINGIFGEDTTKEGLVSQKNKRGKNTTTTVKLYKLAENTYIADTPGFSTFDINEIESKLLSKYFREIKEYEKQCEYIGCGHIKEKEQECAVKKAVKEGKISKERYERFCKIYESIKDKEENKW